MSTCFLVFASIDWRLGDFKPKTLGTSMDESASRRSLRSSHGPHFAKHSLHHSLTLTNWHRPLRNATSLVDFPAFAWPPFSKICLPFLSETDLQSGHSFPSSAFLCMVLRTHSESVFARHRWLLESQNRAIPELRQVSPLKIAMSVWATFLLEKPIK